MHRRILILSLVTSIAAVGCGRVPEPAAAALDLQRRQATERSLGAVVEVARELRDRRGGLTPPTESELFAELQRRTPSAGPGAAAPNDAWGRPLRYEPIQEREGTTLRTGFRVTSAGPDGKFEATGGDDLQRSAIVTETVRAD